MLIECISVIVHGDSLHFLGDFEVKNLGIVTTSQPHIFVSTCNFYPTLYTPYTLHHKQPYTPLFPTLLPTLPISS